MNKGAVLWLAAALGYLIVEATAAAAVVPSYSYAHDYISALGVPSRSPLAAAMNTAFCWQGILFFLGAVFVGGEGRYRRLFLVLAATNAVGNIVVATVHSGSGGWLHGLGALLAIAGGNAAIVAGSSCVTKYDGVRWYRTVSGSLAGLGFLGLALFLLGAHSSHVGSWERVSVYSILLWQTLTGVLLLLAGRSSVRGAVSRGPDR